MQAVRRSMRYAVAGVHTSPRMAMNVQSHVYLPDAETGGMEQEERRVYVHKGPVPQYRKTVTIPLRLALIFLGALFIFYGVKIGSRVVQRNRQEQSIQTLRREIASTVIENQGYAAQVKECRNASRICYKAVQELGMVSPAAVEAVEVLALDTRPYQSAARTAGATALTGTVSGSLSY